MSNDTVVSLAAPAQISDPLTDLLRTGARRLIEAAVSAEFEEYVSAFVQEKLGSHPADGRASWPRRRCPALDVGHRRRPEPRVNMPRSSRVTDMVIALAVGFPPVPGSAPKNGKYQNPWGQS